MCKRERGAPRGGGGGVKPCKSIAYTYNAVITSISFLFSFVSTFLYFGFGLKYGPTALNLLLQTNSNEASEFLHVYFLSSLFWMCLLGYAVGIALVAVLCHKAKTIIKHSKFKVVCLLALLWSAYQFAGFIDVVKQSGVSPESDCIFNLHPRLNANIFVQTDLMYEDWKAKRGIVPFLLESCLDTRIISSTPQCSNIVIVIGESHIKSHSSLYGYTKETNPLLQSMGDSLIIFDDVITPRQITYRAINEMLSVHSTNDGTQWYERPLWLAIFKSAGWHTIFHSNQFNKKNDVEIYASTSFHRMLDVSGISTLCLDYHNPELYTYDGVFLDATEKDIEKEEAKKQNNITIYHFVGQHAIAAERYPHSEAVFHAKDYKDRKDLTERQREEVAHFDNACIYNDKQIYRIMQRYKDKDAVVIYLSDHGENIYDVANHAGREYNPDKYGAAMYHTQFDVPFIVYPTPLYCEHHPEMVQQMRAATKRPFMTDDLSMCLFYLAGIDTEWFKPERCLFHPQYDTKRHRILLTGEDYELKK